MAPQVVAHDEIELGAAIGTPNLLNLQLNRNLDFGGEFGAQHQLQNTIRPQITNLQAALI